MSNAILANKEKPLGLGEVARMHDIHTATLTRWITRGCLAADGERIHLEAYRRGYKWFVSAESVDRFFTRLSVVGETVREQVPTAVERRKQVVAAIRECELAGA